MKLQYLALTTLGMISQLACADEASLKKRIEAAYPKFAVEMMLRHIGWTEAADLIFHGVGKAIQSKRVTGDFSSQMEGATKVGTAAFGDVIIENM